jgi:molybdenum-dependent DNA-binding transcriptional regulator ModE
MLGRMTKGTGTNQRGKRLTPRQVALTKNLLKGATITEAARNAGYSEKNPWLVVSVYQELARSLG